MGLEEERRQGVQSVDLDEDSLVHLLGALQDLVRTRIFATQTGVQAPFTHSLNVIVDTVAPGSEDPDLRARIAQLALAAAYWSSGSAGLAVAVLAKHGIEADTDEILKKMCDIAGYAASEPGGTPSTE
jgi:hypothetical protein